MRFNVLLTNDFICFNDRLKTQCIHQISLLKEKKVSKIVPKINLKFLPSFVKNYVRCLSPPELASLASLQ